MREHVHLLAMLAALLCGWQRLSAAYSTTLVVTKTFWWRLILGFEDTYCMYVVNITNHLFTV